MAWGEPMGPNDDDRIAQCEANSARVLVLNERMARLLLTLTEKDVLDPDEFRVRISRERKALADALGTRG